MKKSNIGLIVTFLIISFVSCLFGMKRNAGCDADGIPAAKAQMQESAKQAPATLVGLINNGSDCFVNSAIQVLYAIPVFREFLNARREDYFLDGDHGLFSIPGQLIQIFEQIQSAQKISKPQEPSQKGADILSVLQGFFGKKHSTSNAVNPQAFRKFVCENSTNPAMRGMLSGQHDSGEFLKLLLEHFQYYTKYHLDLLNVLASLMSGDDGAICALLKKELIDLVILDISDFNNTDQLSFGFFVERVNRRADELRLKISKAKLKEAFKNKHYINFAEYALSTKDLIQQLGQQESETFFGKISDLVEMFKDVQVVCDLFLDKLPHDDGHLITLQACFGENKDWAWLKDKVKYLKLTGADTIYLHNDLVLNKHLDLILGGINSPENKQRIIGDLDHIQRNLLDFRRIFCVRVSDDQKDEHIYRWNVSLNLVSPLAVGFQVLAEISTPLQVGSGYEEDSRPRLKLEDLLNRSVTFDGIAADMPDILIVQPKSFTDEDCTLPNIMRHVGESSKTFGFEMFSGKRLSQGMKIPLVYMPGIKFIIRNQLYELIGMIYHRGDSASRGHFIASCKYGSSWKIFDDGRAFDFDKFYIAHGNFTAHVAIYCKVHSASSLPPAVINVASGSEVKQ